MQKFIQKSFITKPIHVIIDETNHGKLDRTLTLFDLLCIGVGGTVGSGIFVLSGIIAHNYTGPSIVFAWLFAGIACTTSALSYAELSCLIPSAGSAYAYVYVGLGELPAFLAAACLTLEYGFSSAAVASSWGTKVQFWFNSLPGYRLSINTLRYNFLGGFVQLLVTLLLLTGTDISKAIINIFAILKVLLVLFIIITGLMLYNSNNITNWLPYGFNGLLRGSTSCFFGFLGYDEVCCLAGEAKNPSKNLPLAVIGTIVIVTILYVLASLALIGMQNYQTIDINGGFGSAFGSNGWIWAQQIVSFGEIITLPVVVLVSFLAQPKLFYALACDGLLPSYFNEFDNHGNITKGVLISGIMCVIISVIIPFIYLNDIISAGVLISFNLTNTSLLLIRYRYCNQSFHLTKSNSELSIVTNPLTNSTDSFIESIHSETQNQSKQININTNWIDSAVWYERNIVIFHILAVLFAIISIKYQYYYAIILLIIISILIFIIGYILRLQLISKQNNTSMNKTIHNKSINKHSIHINSFETENNNEIETEKLFQVPFMPFFPLIGIIINNCLIIQLSWMGLIGIVIYFCVAIIIYYSFSYYNSKSNEFQWFEQTQMNANNNDIINNINNHINSPISMKSDNKNSVNRLNRNHINNSIDMKYEVIDARNYDINDSFEDINMSSNGFIEDIMDDDLNEDEIQLRTFNSNSKLNSNYKLNPLNK